MNPPAPGVVDLAERLARVEQPWSPRIVATLNDYEVKVAKIHGEFVWHDHADTDELFLVVSGELTIRYRDHEVQLRAGELHVVPRGVEHCPWSAGRRRDRAHRAGRRRQHRCRRRTPDGGARRLPLLSPVRA